MHIWLSLFLINLVGLSDAFYCWECSSENRHCSSASLQDAIDSHCGRNYNYCAIYKATLSNGTTTEFTRACTYSCPTTHTTWETRTDNGVVNHCVYCCNDRYKCNDLIGDPCTATLNMHNNLLIWICALLWLLSH